MNNKDLIKQYVDTGRQLPEYQMDKLSNNDKKTYIRKRIISDDLQEYEYKLLTTEQIIMAISEKVKNKTSKYRVTPLFKELNSKELTPEQSAYIMNLKVTNNYGLNNNELLQFSEKEIYDYFNKQLFSDDGDIDMETIPLIPDDLFTKLISENILNSSSVDEESFALMSDKQKNIVIKVMKDKGFDIPDFAMNYKNGNI